MKTKYTFYTIFDKDGYKYDGNNKCEVALLDWTTDCHKISRCHPLLACWRKTAIKTTAATLHITTHKKSDISNSAIETYRKFWFSLAFPTLRQLVPAAVITAFRNDVHTSIVDTASWQYRLLLFVISIEARINCRSIAGLPKNTPRNILEANFGVRK